MWGSFSRQRGVQTTIPCHKCGEALRCERSCHEVYMRCETCGKRFEASEYIPEMDEAMEDFMSAVYCDRV